MRVLMLATYFPKPLNPLMGNWALAQALAIRREGVELEVISLTAHIPKWLTHKPGARAYSACPLQAEWDGLKVHYPRWPVYPDQVTRGLQFRYPKPFLSLGWLVAHGVLAEHVERFRPDVVYGHHTAVNGWLALQLNKVAGIPYVVTDHDFGEVAACRKFPVRRALFAEVCARASTMVSVASRMEREMVELFPRTITRTVPNGTDDLPSTVLTMPRAGGLRGKTILFSCGHFYERKEFPFLISAFASVANRHPEAILRIAGDGHTRPQIVAEIQKRGLEHRVQLLGRIPHSETMAEMANADAFVLLSRDEPFATVFSEAAAAGKPTVLCNDGGFCDVLDDGVQGLAVPPGDLEKAADALDRILASPSLRQRMGGAAKQLFETRLRWKHNAATMVSIFEEAIREHTASIRPQS